MKYYLQGDIKEVLNSREKISLEQIFDTDEGQQKQRLILIEGAPGIGKSTLAWELCRKWNDFLCMRQFSLVILLRLREKKVQRIESVSDLLYSYKKDDKQTLENKVSNNEGSKILFILDGFDELPKNLQQEGFLFDLIGGRELPKSTVLVTSRPSATADLLTNFDPRVIEILGFTQENVDAYAADVFSSDSIALGEFRSYISASRNPAINSLMYVPLNAAIIAQIYLAQAEHGDSDSLLPHTLTELYSELCLTYLKRYCRLCHIRKLLDLPSNDTLYRHFRELSKLSFEGFIHDQVIFHSIPPGLANFGGFLDAEVALYGGETLSYNFLHLTVQEFFTAYYISELGYDGVGIFKENGTNERWNVVWRFVAGLTKFEHYAGFLTDDDDDAAAFRKEDITLSLFFIQCLFEAQTIKYFSFIKANESISISIGWSSLDMYALGYSIAHLFPDSLLLDAIIHVENIGSFISGLNSTTPFVSAGVIQQSSSIQCLVSLTWKLHGGKSTDHDLLMTRLTELIPRMIGLRSMNIEAE